MVDFSLSKEQEDVARMVKEFAEREVYPTIKEFDRKQEMNPDVMPACAGTASGSVLANHKKLWATVARLIHIFSPLMT